MEGGSVKSAIHSLSCILRSSEHHNTAHQVGGERADEAVIAQPGVLSHCNSERCTFRAPGFLHAAEDPVQMDASVKEYTVVQHDKSAAHRHCDVLISWGLCVSDKSGVITLDFLQDT